MAIVRSTDGRFYNIPDDQLGQWEMGPEEVKDQLGASGGPGPMGQGPGQGQGPGAGPGPGGPQGGDQQVRPHGWCWRNCFSNCWNRNCWRNCY